MPKSCCEVWWEFENEFSQYSKGLPELGYLMLPDEIVGAALAKLHRACRELNAPALYGPDDSILVDVRDDSLFGPSWKRYRPFQAAGLRIPKFQQKCFYAAIERGEICPEWESAPPRSPVNEVGFLLRYLQNQWKQNLQLYSAGEKMDEDVVKTMRQVFREAWHTSVWFYLQGKLSESPIDIREPQTMTAVRKNLLLFEAWLKGACVDHDPTTSSSGQSPESPSEIQAISPVPTEDVTTTTQGQDASHAHMIHNVNEGPPSTHPFGPLIGTKVALGHSLRSNSRDKVSDTAHRKLLAACIDNGKVQLRHCAGERKYELFFSSKSSFDSASKRLTNFPKEEDDERKHNQAQGDESERN